MTHTFEQDGKKIEITKLENGKLQVKMTYPNLKEDGEQHPDGVENALYDWIGDWDMVTGFEIHPDLFVLDGVCFHITTDDIQTIINTGSVTVESVNEYLQKYIDWGKPNEVDYYNWYYHNT